jgi:hypothetical protein
MSSRYSLLSYAARLSSAVSYHPASYSAVLSAARLNGAVLSAAVTGSSPVTSLRLYGAVCGADVWRGPVSHGAVYGCAASCCLRLSGLRGGQGRTGGGGAEP